VEEELASGALLELPYRAGSRFRFAPALVHPADRPLGRAGQRFLELLTAASFPRAPEKPRRASRRGRQRR